MGKPLDQNGFEIRLGDRVAYWGKTPHTGQDQVYYANVNFIENTDLFDEPYSLMLKSDITERSVMRNSQRVALSDHWVGVPKLKKPFTLHYMANLNGEEVALLVYTYAVNEEEADLFTEQLLTDDGYEHLVLTAIFKQHPQNVSRDYEHRARIVDYSHVAGRVGAIEAKYGHQPHR